MDLCCICLFVFVSSCAKICGGFESSFLKCFTFLLRMVIKYASVDDGLGGGNEGSGIVYLCIYLIVCVCEGGACECII